MRCLCPADAGRAPPGRHRFRMSVAAKLRPEQASALQTQMYKVYAAKPLVEYGGPDAFV